MTTAGRCTRVLLCTDDGSSQCWLSSFGPLKAPQQELPALICSSNGPTVQASLDPMKLFRAAQLLAGHNSPPRFRKQPVTSTARTVPQRARISSASHFTAPVWQQALAMLPVTLWAIRFIRATGDCRNRDGWHAARSWNATGVSLTRGTVVQCWRLIRLEYRIPNSSSALTFPPVDKPSPVSMITDREWPTYRHLDAPHPQIVPHQFMEKLRLLCVCHHVVSAGRASSLRTSITSAQPTCTSSLGHLPRS